MFYTMRHFLLLIHCREREDRSWLYVEGVEYAGVITLMAYTFVVDAEVPIATLLPSYSPLRVRP